MTGETEQKRTVKMLHMIYYRKKILKYNNINLLNGYEENCKIIVLLLYFEL